MKFTPVSVGAALIAVGSTHATPALLASAPGPFFAPQHPNPGHFEVVSHNAGVSAMHAALVQNGRVIFLDKVENYSAAHLPDGRMAYSAEFDPISRGYVPLEYKTNAFCSGGSFLADGRVISVGGNEPLKWLDPLVEDGFKAIRYLIRSADNSLDGGYWAEPGNQLASKRWYASAQTMSDGSVFVAAGSFSVGDLNNKSNNNPTYELLNVDAISNGRNVEMDLLVKNQPYYLYPFLHLLRDGSLFAFASKSSQLFSVSDNRIIKALPELPGTYRTYPNTGGSVMLPLTSKTDYAAEIVICGGGEFMGLASPGDPSCGRIKLDNTEPWWEMDAMPEGRVMVEGTLLPDGTVLWLNGAGRGQQGFGTADDPTLDALIYDPEANLGMRWSVAGRSEIPRLYHSVALLLLDGTVLIAGSNPNEMPILPERVNRNNIATKYPTEYRVEIYTPPYLVGDKASKRPQNVQLSAESLIPNGSSFYVSFTVPWLYSNVTVLLSHGGYVTHSLHMGQRMVALDTEQEPDTLLANESDGRMRLRVTMPETRWGNHVLPPGPYVLYVVLDGVPSVGKFVMVGMIR